MALAPHSSDFRLLTSPVTQLWPGSYIPVLHAGRVKKVPDDCALRVDPVSIRRRGTGKVQLSENTALIQEAMAVSGGISKAANDIGPGIQAKSK